MLEMMQGLAHRTLLGLGGVFATKLAHDMYYADWSGVQKTINQDYFNVLMRFSYTQNKVNQKLGPFLAEIQEGVVEKRNMNSPFMHFENGVDEKVILHELSQVKSQIPAEDQMKFSGAVYTPQDNEQLRSFRARVHELSAYTNPLHPDIWAKIQEIAAQAVNAGLEIFNHAEPSKAFGTIVPGGTYGIIEAVKAYRDRAQDRSLVGKFMHYVFDAKPEIIVPDTAHAAFDKAASMFGCKLIKVPVDPETQRANVDAMRRAITKNTILMVGSAPSYPTGTMDDIPALAKIAKARGIGLHVDACLGGFVLPFMEDAGFELPFAFDFRVDGVTSISSCTHKSGEADKGSSLIMFRDAALGKYMMSTHMDWSGGLYATPGMGGSSSGYAMASAWASMFLRGRDGYIEQTRKIIHLSDTIKTHIMRNEPHFNIKGRADANVIAIECPHRNIHVLADLLKKRGWHYNVLPNAIHFCLTGVHADHEGFVDLFIKDLSDCMALTWADTDFRVGGDGAIYGATATLPAGFDALKSHMAKEYILTQWKTHGRDLNEKNEIKENAIKNPTRSSLKPLG